MHVLSQMVWCQLWNGRTAPAGPALNSLVLYGYSKERKELRRWLVNHHPSNLANRRVTKECRNAQWYYNIGAGRGGAGGVFLTLIPRRSGIPE